ncbi:MAG TPA: 3-methyl-2-oxobutanoate hydroxymethyltransferase [Spirochaetota bacterium]|nr:3-methyl-2-oxobutanoate hydroxymethyltransferase [Spirochaetota bacterium]HOM38361.1 3-methyl-2-oxobutanoate hydroxymethyltransferase [Spirochaetota bacterium]HPQ48421.1 3-methyl-2-oxobutanoate hydroxymethyltransferase [Spirochaetota bacterium]
MNKKTISFIRGLKGKRKITMLTCYDYSMARIFDNTDLDIVLVGDSVGNVFSGYETTLPVTIDEIIYHTKAVKRGCKNQLIVSDMPFMSYQISINDAINNAGRLMKEGLCDAVKLEGGEEIALIVEKLVKAGIPVMGHIGLQPQSVHAMGGYKVIGKKEDEVKRLVNNAKILEESGAFAIVLELVKKDVAKEITNSINIPTIGIGSGPYCDGQVLVINDMLGLNPENFKHNKKYLNLYSDIENAVNNYIKDVIDVKFPSDENSF